MVFSRARGVAAATVRVASTVGVLGVFASFLLPHRALAEVRLDIQVGHADTYIAGGWTPLRILMENRPEADRPSARSDFKGRIQVTVVGLDGGRAQYAQPIELPVPSTKRTEFSVILPERLSPVLVELVDDKKGVVLRREYQLGPRPGALKNLRGEVLDTPTVLVLVDATESVGFPTFISRAINLQRVGRESLPSDFKSYQGVRMVVVRQKLSGRLTQNQLDALETWVELGGVLLVVTPRAQSEIRQDPWLMNLMPAAIEGSVDISLGELIEGSGDELTLATEWGELRPDARVLSSSKAMALALERPIGSGRVVALGVDPSSMAGDTLRSPLAARILGILDGLILAPTTEDLRARHFWSTANVTPNFTGASDGQIMILPNIYVVTLLLALFVLAVGPVNFYLLRRRRRLELAWVTIPALSIGFFVAVYAYGMAAKGGDQHFASAEIVHLQSGNSHGLVLWSSIQFSPKKRTYHLTAPPGSTVAPLISYYNNPLDYGSFGQRLPSLTSGVGLPGALDSSRPAVLMPTDSRGYELFYPAEQWKMVFYQGERPIEIDGTITGRLVAEGGSSEQPPRLTLYLDNDTDTLLAEAIVYVGERPYRIGHIPPRTSIEHQLDTHDVPFEYVDGFDELTREDDSFHQGVSDHVRTGSFDHYPIRKMHRPQRRVRLMARQGTWTSEMQVVPPPDFSKTCALVEIELPLEIKGQAVLTTGGSTPLLRTEVYNFDPNGASLRGDANELATLNDSWMEYLISPPRLARSAVFIDGNLTVRFNVATDRLDVLVFNYETGAWQAAMGRGAASRSNSNPPLSTRIDPRWVNPIGNLIRVRLVSKPLPNVTGNRLRSLGVQVLSIGARLTLAERESPNAESPSVPAGP